MAEENKAVSVILALLIGIASGAGMVSLQESDLDGIYYCPVNDLVGEYDRLSSSAKTAYPTAGTTKGNKRCIDSDGVGAWALVKDYADQTGLSIGYILAQANAELSGIPLPSDPDNVLQYSCGAKCVVK